MLQIRRLMLHAPHGGQARWGRLLLIGSWTLVYTTAHVQISVTQGLSHNYQYHIRDEVVDNEAEVEVHATEHTVEPQTLAKLGRTARS